MCEIRSRHETKLRSTSTLRTYITAPKGGVAPDIVMCLPFLTNSDIPVVCMFRLLGFEDIEQVSHMILNTDELKEELGPLLQNMLDHASNEMNLEELFEWVGHGERERENTPQKRKRYVAHLLENEVLPQLGFINTPEVRHRKGLFIAIMARRLLKAYKYTIQMDEEWTGSDKQIPRSPEIDDRDHCANKRIVLPGQMLSVLFRQLFRKFIKQLRIYLFKVLSPANDHNRSACLNLNITEAIQNKKITAALRVAFSGRWSAHRNNSTHTAVTQVPPPVFNCF